MNEITGHTRLCAVIAKPIKHSISPLIHNTAFQALAIDAVYLAFEIEETSLANTVETIRAIDMLGANVSMPYKESVMPFMDELTSSARLIGAVNTIIHRKGRLIGHNTDGIGFMTSVKELGVEIIGKKMVLLGAGGAATAIIAQAALDGVKEIFVFNRVDDFWPKAQEKINRIVEKTNAKIHLLDIEEKEVLKEKIAESSLLVQATSVGMKEEASLIPALDFFHKDLSVLDVIYNPRETKLLKQAREFGLEKTANGLGMLLYQAAASFEEWTGKVMPVAIVQEKMQEVEARDKNLSKRL